jgi:hypothetical protein
MFEGDSRKYIIKKKIGIKTKKRIENLKNKDRRSRGIKEYYDIEYKSTIQNKYV